MQWVGRSRNAWFFAKILRSVLFFSAYCPENVTRQFSSMHVCMDLFVFVCVVVYNESSIHVSFLVGSSSQRHSFHMGKKPSKKRPLKAGYGLDEVDLLLSVFDKFPPTSAPKHDPPPTPAMSGPWAGNICYPTAHGKASINIIILYSILVTYDYYTERTFFHSTLWLLAAMSLRVSLDWLEERSLSRFERKKK